ncbi:protein sidekick-2-like [Antrostomus carolinensis]|uniref:protein sidekick-2-like n=1 Tax=Antrostomus carolinensis TaxID=279965 RepID=UPI0005292636|nr:protein sidekick-2-like [Antrostomus carolinensis]
MECVANARPLIKLHIIWKKDGVPLSSGISDYSRRLTILNPALSDSGYYEGEAVLRRSRRHLPLCPGATTVCQGAREAHHGRDGEGGGHPLPSQR